MIRLKWLAPVLTSIMVTTVAQANTPLGELVGKMDVTAPKYQSEACVAARSAAVNFDEHSAERFATGLVAGVALGLIALPMAVGSDIQFAKKRNAVADALIEACGSEAFLTYVHSNSLGGNAAIQTWIARGYESDENWPEAISWYQHAADQNNTDAEANLGTIYYQGHGVPQDYSHAIALWKKAMDGGSNSAQNNLAQAYLDGKGVPEDHEKAFDLYRSTARRGDPEAQLKLAALYEAGDGVMQSSGNAYIWYSMAASNGEKEGAAKQDALAQSLSTSSRQYLNYKALHCRSSHYQQCT